MFEFVAYLIMLAMVGFTVGVGVLIHREAKWYQKFLSEHPVLGCTASFITGGLAIYAASYLLMVVVLSIIGLLLGGHQATPTLQ